MHTIQINNEPPIECTDYCITSIDGNKTLYMSFKDKEDVGIQLAQIHDLSIKTDDKGID